MISRSGTGYWIGPAVTPDGSRHAMAVSIPLSPGFFQYPCQPFSGRMIRASVTVWPGATVRLSGTRLVAILFLACTGAASSNAATNVITR
jgi:hypothetical protein